MDASRGEAAGVRSTCPYCGVGCGVIATPRADGSVSISGDPEHPANFGRLCSKGSALSQTLSLEGRLLHPEVAGERVSWSDALDVVAHRFSKTIADHGPESVAFYVSGQLLTEDYYVANKLMKGFIGTANIDTNSRLCMASSVAGHKRAFGSDTVPGCYEDLECADLVVLVGSNLAWCHPVLFQRLAAARDQRGTKVVVIDPRRTATCEIADQHLAIKGGSDVALFNGLFAHLATDNRIDDGYVAEHTRGFDEALQEAKRQSLADISALTELAAQDIAAFYELFARTERVVTVYSQGVNQSTAGTDKVNAIINCHLATGRIGKPGMGPFSVTGQPNAMGGREVGGLANMLAAHLELDDARHRRIVQSFWNSPRIATKPGLKAIDLFRAVGDGRIKALWIMATNPAVSLPASGEVRKALQSCPFVVVSDVERHTDTTGFADVLLPSAGWGEKDGTVTNSERRISRQRTFMPVPGEARADWWQLAQVARRMGFAEHFAWSSPSEIFAEYAALTAVENGGTRDLDLSKHVGSTDIAYQNLMPFQWPQRAGEDAPTKRFFADGRFFTPDGRARFVTTPYRMPATLPDTERRLVLNTGRIRDHWHTMTRTARSPRLSSHIAEPFVEINPRDAHAIGVRAADLVTVHGRRGSAILRAVVTDRVAEGSIFAPMHWSDQYASSALVGGLLDDNVDPVSGQPELKHGAVRLERFPAKWFAFAAACDKPRLPAGGYSALARTASGWQLELASDSRAVGSERDGADLLAELWPADADTNTSRTVLAYRDNAHGRQRFAVFEGDRLVAALFLERTPVACARGWLAGEVGRSFPDATDRYRILAARPGSAVKDRGAIVCSCLGIGRNDISDAIARGCRSVAEVGTETGAGTNCGSCRPEIARLIEPVFTAEQSSIASAPVHG